MRAQSSDKSASADDVERLDARRQRAPSAAIAAGVVLEASMKVSCAAASRAATQCMIPAIADEFECTAARAVSERARMVARGREVNAENMRGQGRVCTFGEA
eukprot:6209570-Pleurochrysis_carterae.AAC.5